MLAHLNLIRGSKSRPENRARDRRRRLSLESLEGRQLMSLGSEFLAPVNATTRNAQFEPDTASAAGGTSVIVWTDTYSAADHDIRAQRYNASGGKLGPEIVVSYSGLDEGSPAVAMDDQGRFEVAWTQRLGNGDTNVVARRFDANGNAVGNLIEVGVGTFRESDPDVAADLSGNFVVSYTRDTNNNNPDIFAKRYNSDGLLLNVVNVAVSSRAETHSSVAMTPDGRFDVAWEEAFSSTDHDIKLGRYSPSGTLLGLTGIASSYLSDVSPSLAVDNLGNGVVVWEQAGNILARRFDSSGTPAFYDFNITSTSAPDRTPSVAIRRGGGSFVVAYETFDNGIQTRVAEVSSANTITTLDAGGRSAPAVSIDAYGNYTLADVSSTWFDSDIRARRGALR